MINKLSSGCFLGRVLVRRQYDGIVLTETCHQRSDWLPTHAHQNAYFCLVRRGQFAERYGQKERLCTPMTLTFHPPEERHSEQIQSPNSSSFNIELEPRRIEQFRPFGLRAEEPSEFQGGPLTDIMLRLQHEFHHEDAVSHLAVEGLTLELLSHFVRAGRPHTPAMPHWLNDVRDLMHERYADKLELRQLAAVAGVHPVYFIQVFRKHFDCTPGAYQRRLRVEAAKQCLVREDLGLSEIALRVGFVDQSHFTRTFKQHTGTTPAAFRRTARGAAGIGPTPATR